MATTRGWALKGNIVNAVSYVLDLKNNCVKTENGLYVCNSEEGMGLLSAYRWKEEHKDNFNDSVGYHLQFSLPADEGTAEDCMMLAEQWIKDISNDKAKYVIAVHTNTNNIHAHIICDWYLKDGTRWNIYWKREKKKFRASADRICREHGFSTLANEWETDINGKTRSYYEYSDNSRELLRKVLKNTIPRVSSYEELKKYMEAIGFKLYDGTNEENKNIFSFTADIKLIHRTDDGRYLIRIPYHSELIKIDEEYLKWIKDGKTARIQLPVDMEINVFDSNRLYLNTVSASELKASFEEKVASRRDGLRVRVPGAKKVIRTRRLEKDENGDGYSLDEIKKRIFENGRTFADERIINTINGADDFKLVESERQYLYESAGIKLSASSSTVFRSKKQERYFIWKSEQVQKQMDRLNYSNLLHADRINLPEMKSRREELQKQIGELNKLIRGVEDNIELIVQNKMEGIVEISDTEIEKYIIEHKTPLLVQKDNLKDMIRVYTERISAAEEFQQNEEQRTKVR